MTLGPLFRSSFIDISDPARRLRPSSFPLLISRSSHNYGRLREQSGRWPQSHVFDEVVTDYDVFESQKTDAFGLPSFFTVKAPEVID